MLREQPEADEALAAAGEKIKFYAEKGETGLHIQTRKGEFKTKMILFQMMNEMIHCW